MRQRKVFVATQIQYNFWEILLYSPSIPKYNILHYLKKNLN